MKIPGYELQDTLGAGGMASVYRAVQLSLNRLVALKLMREDLSRTPDYTRRFLIEARSVAQLQHRHIISIYDVGTAKDIHFYSMQLLEGGNLLERIQDGSMDRKEIVQALVAVCDALQYSHERGFIHRDVKPANILFDSHNEPYLTDFGLVRDLNTTSALTAAGHSLGTSLYMSPEQITGQSVSPKCDLYGLGVTAYEAIIGTTPYQGESSIAVAYQHVNEPVPKLPKGLSAWQSFFNRAMAKEPENRFDNAAEMASALRELLNNDEAINAKEDLTDSGEHVGDATMIMPTISGEAEFKELRKSAEDEEDFGTVVMKTPAAAGVDPQEEDSTQRIHVEPEDSEPDTAEQPKAAEPPEPAPTMASAIDALGEAAPTPEEPVEPGPSSVDKAKELLAGVGEKVSAAWTATLAKVTDLNRENPKALLGGLGAAGAIALGLVIWGLWPDAPPAPEPPPVVSADRISDLRTRLLSDKVSFDRELNDLQSNSRWSAIREQNADLIEGLSEARLMLDNIESQLDSAESLTVEAFSAIEMDLGNADRQGNRLLAEVRKLLPVPVDETPELFVVNTEIEVVLEAARSDIEAGNLFSPADNNAADKILSALEIDPSYRNTLTLRAELTDQLMTTAQDHFDGGHLVSPENDNALALIEQVELLDPESQRAQTMRVALANGLLELARADLEAGNLLEPADNATTRLQAAAGIAPASEASLNLRNEVVTALLALVQTDIEENRLTSPRGQNAEEKLDIISELDPENAQVVEYRAQIGNRYLALITRELQRASPRRSSMTDWLDQARKFGAPEDDIAAMRGRIAENDQVSFVADLNSKADKLMEDERFNEARLMSLDILRIDAQNRKASGRLARIEDLTKAGFIYFHEFEDGARGPTMVVLRGDDSVAMPGSSKTVFMTKAFAISTNEISRDLFARFAQETNYQPDARGGRNCRKGTPDRTGSAFSKKVSWDDPGFSQAQEHPAVCVDFSAAVKFTQWLSMKTGRNYRLPSEMEWEYATQVRRSKSVSSSGACDFDNLADQSFVSSERHRDAFRCDDGAVYTSSKQDHNTVDGNVTDLGGNVSEWTLDCWNKSLAGRPSSAAPWLEGDCRKRVVRGGSFRTGTKDHPLDYREGAALNLALDSLGFRVVREYE